MAWSAVLLCLCETAPVVAAAGAETLPPGAAVVYVDDSAIGANDGSTWFNENWKDFVDYTPPPQPAKIVGGLPLPDQEPSGHNDLAAQITEKMAFCEEHLADKEWDGAPPDLNWLNMAAGKLILEYSERFPKGPHIQQYSTWLDQQSEKVLSLMDST